MIYIERPPVGGLITTRKIKPGGWLRSNGRALKSTRPNAQTWTQ